MPTLDSSVTVAAPIDEVWDFHQDVEGGLPALSPPESGVRVESAEPLPPRVGTRVVISAKAPVVGRITWHAEYVGFQEPQSDSAAGGRRSAFFVDEQRRGPFKAWRHTHSFAEAPGGGTLCRDHVEYEVPGGPLSGLANALVVRGQLDKMFAHRREALVERFGAGEEPGA